MKAPKCPFPLEGCAKCTNLTLRESYATGLMKFVGPRFLASDGEYQRPVELA